MLHVMYVGYPVYCQYCGTAKVWTHAGRDSTAEEQFASTCKFGPRMQQANGFEFNVPLVI